MQKSTLALKDYRAWNSTNSTKHFNLFDYLNFVNRSQQYQPCIDAWVAFAEIFLPNFIEINGSVFIEECYLGYQTEYQRLIADHSDKKTIELFTNAICVDGLLYNLPGDDDETCLYICHKIKEGWTLKLQREFPDRQFTVVIDKDDDVGDLLMTFYED